MTNLINSNNLTEIKKFIDYLDGKIWIHGVVFLHMKIDKLNKEKEKESPIKINYNDLDKKIIEYQNQQKIVYYIFLLLFLYLILF